MGIDLPVIWAVISAFGLMMYVGDGRFRPWNRHPLSVHPRRAIATPW